jgi:hypothetical protein
MVPRVGWHFRLFVWTPALLSLFIGGPVSAQSFFDLIFGGPARRENPASTTRSYADPNADPRSLRRSERHTRKKERSLSDSIGSGRAYCVRLCDGRYFPIHYRGGSAATELCKAFCPASPTKIFAGSLLRDAVSPDGKRYSEIPNAFVYREKLIPDCTCDGKSPGGLAQQNTEADPTLQSGDIVVTDTGLKAVRGESRQPAEFTPIDRAALPPALRKQLSVTRIQPAPKRVEETTASGDAPITSRNVDQRGRASK